MVDGDGVVQGYGVAALGGGVAGAARFKGHDLIVEGVGAHLELADLRVQREFVEAHWANKGDVGGLGVEDALVGVDPQPGHFVENVDDLVGLEVVDENIG